MERPHFPAPMKPHHASWMAGEITALECKAAEYREEIAYHTAVLRAPCPPMCRAYHRRERARFYGKLRDLRKRRIH